MADKVTTAATSAPLTTEQASEEAAYTLGVQAYLWGVPFVEYAKTGVGGLEARAVALNSFRKYPVLKTAKDRFVVTPNNVTIDGYGVCDLRDEPAVIFVPRLTEDRWYIVQLGDYYDEIFHNIGGTKGQQPGAYLVTGPDFSGTIPGEMTQLRSRTRWAAAALRVFVKGGADLPAAVEAQKGFHLMPLSAYLRHGLSYTPPDASLYALPPLPSAEAPENLRFFEDLGHWMKFWLPSTTDRSDALVNTFQQIGLSCARGLEWQTLGEPAKRGLARAARAGARIVEAAWASTGETTHGWKYTLAGGRAGHDLALRAALAKYEVGAQLSDQVIYPNCAVDAQGKSLDGANKYALNFAKGQQPPVAVFWNLAMYGADMLFVDNDFGRCSIGSTTDGLKANPDGSLTIRIEHAKPDDTSNWLPAPAGPFNLTMRFYGPRPSVLDGSYRLPPVTRQ
ncbi:MAG: DUF1214 domain-containing protein [Gammaproteobacteria bacterium]